MKFLIAFLALVCGLAFVQASPLANIGKDRIDSKASLREIRTELEKILKALEIEIPDDIQLPPRVRTSEGIAKYLLKSGDFQSTNIIAAPTYCEEGYKMYNGQCRRVFFYLPRQRP